MPDSPERHRSLVELSHPVRSGMVTLPGFPGPEVGPPHLTHEAARDHYAAGTSFEIGRIAMIGNTGTYVDSPAHRHPGTADLGEVPLDRLADLPTTVIHLPASPGREITAHSLAGHEVRGRAVLLHTGDDATFGTPEYVREPHFLTHDGATWLVDQGAILVGIDAPNIDDMTDGTRPAHTILLASDIPIVEHLTGLAALPTRGARFTAAPPRIAGMVTFPVRAFAVVADPPALR